MFDREINMTFIQKFLGLFFILWVAGFSNAEGWELIDEQEGITASRKAVENSDLVAFRGEGLVDASMARIVAVLMDHKHKDKWVDRLYVSRELESLGEMETIQYAAFKMPLVVSNRDFVYHYDIQYVKETGGVDVYIKSVEHASAPKTVGVRGTLNSSRYTMLPREGGAKTFLVAEMHADPKGWLPTWLVNALQKKWPIKTIKGLREQVKKPYYKDYQVIVNILKSEANR